MINFNYSKVVNPVLSLDKIHVRDMAVTGSFYKKSLGLS